MKACLLVVPALWCVFLLVGIGLEPIGVVDAQSIVSPFIMLCRRTCGGFGFFRRLCCMVDSICCSKPDSCPDDTTADTLIPFCQTCTEDVDCLFRSKCCDSGDRKCCTAIRSIVLRNSFFIQRAKEKKNDEEKKNDTAKKNDEEEDTKNTANSNSTDEAVSELAVEDAEKEEEEEADETVKDENVEESV